jgi:hypothetical protein
MKADARPKVNNKKPAMCSTYHPYLLVQLCYSFGEYCNINQFFATGPFGFGARILTKGFVLLSFSLIGRYMVEAFAVE